MNILGTKTNKKSKTSKKRRNKSGKERQGKILFSYGSKRRISEIKRLKYLKMIEKKKENTQINTNSEINETIKKAERRLSKHNAKTANYEKFKKYMKEKIKLRMSVSHYELSKTKEKNDKITNSKDEFVYGKITEVIGTIELENGIKYNEYVKKLKWFSYINKKRHEEEILNDIENIYGKDAIFVVGDWGAKGKIRRISMPNTGMKKMLSRRFKVYLVDEYNTSKLYYKTEEECKILIREIKYEKEGEERIYKKKVHSVLTYEKEKKHVNKDNNNKIHLTPTYQKGKKGIKCIDKKVGCINRDYNACLNMMKIVAELIKTKKRPIKFCRKVKKVTCP